MTRSRGPPTLRPRHGPPLPSPLQLHNTLTRRVEPFTPAPVPRVTLYTCGPTVWNYAHIGNFRTFLFEDLLRRFLEFAGYEVFHIMNLTDVDDRTIKAAAAAHKSLADHTAPFVTAFFEDRDYLRIKPAHVYPRATQTVPAMVALVERLLERGVAYASDDGSVYFAIAKFPTYGRSRSSTRASSRRAPACPATNTPRTIHATLRSGNGRRPRTRPWGRRGTRPSGVAGLAGTSSARRCRCPRSEAGSASRRSTSTRGIDLVFPHHEDEIAQSEAATGQPFVRHWLHGEFLNVRGTKMSKRFGNFLTARDLRDQGVDAAAIRLLFWQTHYRQSLDFNDAALEGAREGVRRLGEFHDRLAQIPATPAGAGRSGAAVDPLDIRALGSRPISVPR